MPRTRKPAKSARERLSDLPRRADLTLVGGIQPLPIYVREKGAAVQPQLALWMDGDGGYMYAFGLISPTATHDNGVSEALDALYQAIVQPSASPGMLLPAAANPDLPQPSLPARVLVNDVALAAAARVVLEPLGVAVEHRESLPLLEAAVAELAESLGVEPGTLPPEPFSWAIDPALLPPLYKAAAGLWRRAPWEYLPDHPPVVLGLGTHGPREGVERLFASIMGLAEEVYGVAFYYSQEALDRIVAHGEARAERARAEGAEVSEEQMSAALDLLRQMGLPVDQMPPEVLRSMVGPALAEPQMSDEELDEMQQLTEDSLLVFFDPKDEVDPTYAEWIQQHRLPTASSDAVPTFVSNGKGGEHAEPNVREARALTLALEALNQFFSKHRRQLETYAGTPPTITYQAMMQSATGAIPVQISFSPPVPQGPRPFLELLQDLTTLTSRQPTRQEPKQHATGAGRTTLYRFQVKLDWQKSVWRRIELRGDQTLDDLHNAIQEAFGWDNDHLYAFFLSGEAWDEATTYESPLGDGRHADRYRVEHLSLGVGQRFLYLFDFGDQLEHSVKLEAIMPGGVQKGVSYPRITERHGANVPQYPDLDEDEE